MNLDTLLTVIPSSYLGYMLELSTSISIYKFLGYGFRGTAFTGFHAVGYCLHELVLL